MANTKGRPKQPGGEGTQVRFDSDIARKAKIIASERRTSIASYLGDMVRDQVDRDYEEVVKSLGKGSRSKGTKSEG